MNSTGRKIKRFVRKDTAVVLSIPLMLVLNWMTNLLIPFPWAAIPIIGIFIALADDFVKIFLAEDGDEDVVRAEATVRRQEKKSRPVVDANLSAQLTQAARYKAQLDALVKSTSDSGKLSRLNQLSTQMDEWYRSVETMAERVTAFRNDAAIQHDLQTVPESVRKLTAQLAAERDPRVRAQLETTLATRANQLESLQKLQAVMRQAEVQIENTVAALGTLYSQALSLQGTNQVADYSHLSAEVGEQVQQLNEQIEALEEIKLDGRSV